MKQTASRGVTKEHPAKWLSDTEIKAISAELELSHNPEHLIIFQLLLCTGHKFSRLAKVTWGEFNARLGILYLGDRAVRLPDTVAKGLLGLREFATGEDKPIIKTRYKKFWEALERVCNRLGIEQTGVLCLRNTFALKHWTAYQSRAKLRHDLGLTSLRHLPKEIFQTRPQSLFQGVL